MPASPAVGGGVAPLSVRPLSPPVGGAGAAQAMEAAGRSLERLLVSDAQLPGLAERLHLQQGCPSVSGLNEADYPSLSGQLQLPQLRAVKKAPLPAELVEHFEHLQSNCMMGLFPELGRAWLTIDNDIYMWLFESGGDLTYYDGLSETILAVGLVRPRLGVFQSHIQHLLCLATPLEFLLLGVTFSGGGTAEMHVLPEPLFSVASDGAYVTTVAGTASGRVFLGARDGCLYELVYQATDSWLSRRCRKINHSASTLSLFVPAFLSAAFSDEDPLLQLAVDDSRNVLYTRSQKGTVQVYDLGSDGRDMVRVAALSQSSIIQSAAGIARTVDQSIFGSLLDISPLAVSECLHVQLLVTTGAGVRLYFSTGGGRRPSTLALRHIRLPPGFAANAPLQRPVGLHKAMSVAATALLVSAQSDEVDALWLLSGDALPSAAQLTELHGVLALDGHTWALSPLPDAPLVSEPTCTESGEPQLAPPLVVVQHARRPRRYVALSSRGVQLLEQLRPVDQLRALLEEHGRPDADAVRAFFTLHSEAQACAACLILACSETPQDQAVAGWAARAFFLYGGEPQMTIGAGTPSTPPSALFQPQQMSTPLAGRGLSYSPGEPVMSPPPGELIFSGKHDGLYLYAARLLRPLWGRRVVQAFSPRPGQVELVSAATSAELGWLSAQLEALSRFLARHSQVCAPPFGDTVSTQQLQQRMNSYLQQEPGALGGAGGVQPGRAQQALAAERYSLAHLRQLVAYTRQVLGLLQIVTDHQTHVVTAALSHEDQSSLRLMTLRDLTLSGRDMCTQLISALIGRYLQDNASTEAVSARLRQLAPAIYRAEHALSSRASELLVQARAASSAAERERLQREALQLAKQVAGQLQLPAVCRQFQAAHDYEGVVELTLAAAEKRDPSEVALHYYNAGEPPEDSQGREAYIARSECYDVVLEQLSTLTARAESGGGQSPVPARPGPPPAAPPAEQRDQAARQAERVLEAALRSSDQLLHVAVYSWLVAGGHTDRLLQVKSPFLEAFLTRTSGAAASVRVLDLLWKHYERNNKHLAAAKVLAKLAERHGAEVLLPQRIEYLARAILCVKSGQSMVSLASQGEFLHELEEKMEVARVQAQVLEAVRARHPDRPDRETALHVDLLDVTALYQLCEQLQLPGCQLAIVVCAGHRDAALVRALWTALLRSELAAAGAAAEAAAPAVTELARQYVSQPAYFPLETVVSVLEAEACRRGGQQPGWPAAALADAGVPLPQLLSVYQSLYRQNDPVWTEHRRPLHLLYAISHIVTTFSSQPESVSARSRRAFTSTCLDLVAAYINDLYASSAPGAGLLVAQLKAAQSRLERLSV